jgi:Endonuclease I
MRGDIHHLFACEMGCNSFRGNFPYFDFPDTEEVTREACGRCEDIGFEPGAGKGPVARATLYFLLRYPGVVGDPGHELTAERLPMLLDWHEADPSATTSFTATTLPPGSRAIATRLSTTRSGRGGSTSPPPGHKTRFPRTALSLRANHKAVHWTLQGVCNPQAARRLHGPSRGRGVPRAA